MKPEPPIKKNPALNRIKDHIKNNKRWNPIAFFPKSQKRPKPAIRAKVFLLERSNRRFAVVAVTKTEAERRLTCTL